MEFNCILDISENKGYYKMCIKVYVWIDKNELLRI